MIMAVYKRREFRLGDLVILNQTKLRDIPASLVSLVLSNVGKIVTRFRIIAISDGLVTIKCNATEENFNVPVNILVASFNNVNKVTKKTVVVNVEGIEVFGKLIKYGYRVKGKIKKEDGEIINFNCSKNNLGFVEEI